MGNSADKEDQWKSIVEIMNYILIGNNSDRITTPRNGRNNE